MEARDRDRFLPPLSAHKKFSTATNLVTFVHFALPPTSSRAGARRHARAQACEQTSTGRDGGGRERGAQIRAPPRVRTRAHHHVRGRNHARPARTYMRSNARSHTRTPTRASTRADIQAPEKRPLEHVPIRTHTSARYGCTHACKQFCAEGSRDQSPTAENTGRANSSSISNTLFHFYIYSFIHLPEVTTSMHSLGYPWPGAKPFRRQLLG